MENNRVVLITAASQGIGYGIAQELSSQGWKVALLARSEKIETIAKQLGGFGFRGSVTSSEDLHRFVEAALQRFGRIDAVVNNTGHPAKGAPLSLTDDQWQQGYELILASVIRLARLVTPHMIAAKRGAFVNVSSNTATRPDKARPVSSVMRAALSAWTRVHAEEVAPHGIRVNSVLPGYVDSYPVDEDIIKTIPMGRIGRVQELAKVISFLVSDEASFVTGQNLLVDGGMIRTL
jgi:NAD(P)-dependent dehydrogenase (short-subunit alcohol dehydrogenase family)